VPTNKRAKKQAPPTPHSIAGARVVKDAETLKAFADPTRIQILMLLGDGPKTVKDVAAMVGLLPTRLYYHFKILERADLIKVTRRRMVSGIEERTYAATATSWTPSPEVTTSLVPSGVIDALLEVVRAELELALRVQADVPLGEPGSPVPVFSLTRLALSDDDAAEVQRRLEAIILEFGDTGGKKPKGKRYYNVLLAGYQAPSELGDAAAKEAS